MRPMLEDDSKRECWRTRSIPKEEPGTASLLDIMTRAHYEPWDVLVIDPTSEGNFLAPGALQSM